MRAVNKNTIREISKSRNRFLSIFLICAIGVGFFSGVRATCEIMKVTADDYYDANNLFDLRVLSTFGLTDDDAKAIAETDGVDGVYTSKYTDLAMHDNEKEYLTRVYSKTSDEINTVDIFDGEAPSADDECIVSYNILGGGISVGDTVTLTDLTEAEEFPLKRTEYKVVGIYNTPMYISKTQRGSTNIGDGALDAFMIVPEEHFTQEVYTEIYIKSDKLKNMQSYSNEYKTLRDEISDKLESLGKDRSVIRYNEVIGDAQAEIDKGEKELAEAKADGQKELDDAKKQLDDAKQQIEDGERELQEAKDDIADGKIQLTDAEKELADAKKEIEDGKRELAENKPTLDDAKKQLEDALKEIEDGERQLADGKKTLDEAKVQIDESQKEIEDSQKLLDDSRTEIEKNRKLLEDGQAEINKNKAELEDGKNQIELAKIELANGWEQYRSGLEEYQTGLEQYEQAVELFNRAEEEYEKFAAENPDSEWLTVMQQAIQASRETLEQMKTQIDEGKAQLDSALAQLEAGEREIAVNEEKIADGEAQLEESQKQIDDGLKQLADGEKQLEDGQQQLNEGRKKLEEGKAQYEDGLAEYIKNAELLADGRREYDKGLREYLEGLEQYIDGLAKIEDGEKQYYEGMLTLNEKRGELDDGVDQYEQGLIEIEDAKRKYEEGLRDYEDGVYTFNREIADAEKKIADAKEKISDIGNAEWYIFKRDDNTGYAEYDSNSERINKIAAIFPVFFLLVAGLVCLTTMSRMVEEQRTQVGTLKALGYSNGAIMRHYMTYAVSGAAAGGIIGAIGGCFLFPSVIVYAYSMMYIITDIHYLFTPENMIVSIGSMVLAIAATVFFSCNKALQETPASLMRPKAPKAGKRVLIERIPFLWNNMNFFAKVSGRNLFRYKRRMFMTIVGIAGCTALSLTGFGLKNSITDIVDLQYNQIYKYSGYLAFDDEIKPSELNSIYDTLLDYDGNTKYTRALIKQYGTEFSGNSVQVYVTAVENAELFETFVDLHERVSREKLTLNSGAVITEKAAKLLNAGVGDEITVQVSDGVNKKVKIAGITEQYTSHYLYIAEDLYKEVFGGEPYYNMLYFDNGISRDKDVQNGFTEHVLKNDNVLAVIMNASSLSSVNDTLQIMDLVTVVLIVSAAALAFVVLYNLTNVNITERIREIATLKVLGFYDAEVSSYVFRENIVLSVMGGFVGLFLGYALCMFVIQTAEIDEVMFGRSIHFPSYIWALLVTVAFSLIVNLIMTRVLKKISMVESLKSVE